MSATRYIHVVSQYFSRPFFEGSGYSGRVIPTDEGSACSEIFDAAGSGAVLGLLDQPQLHRAHRALQTQTFDEREVDAFLHLLIGEPQHPLPGLADDLVTDHLQHTGETVDLRAALDTVRPCG